MDPTELDGAPARLGPYELLLPIGRGGAATVYLAKKSMVAGIEREVAIKLILPWLRDDPEVARHLIEEAKIAASIRHPNVVSVIEVGQRQGEVYLVCEYVEGATLAGLMSIMKEREQTIPHSIASAILRNALDGLHAAHELMDAEGRPVGLVHRDFSPQNILVGSEGIARLTDFGIAKFRHRLPLTQTGIIKGKTGYMSPEQVFGYELDRRSDVWAAGVVVWEVLAGRRLFRSKDEVEKLQQIVAPEPVPSVRRFRPDLPLELDRVVARALAKDRSERYDSAFAFRTELMHAWARLGEPADVEDVARFVARNCESTLAERRRRAAEVIERRAKPPVPRLAADSVVPRRRWTTAWAIGFVLLSLTGGAIVLFRRSMPSSSVSPQPAKPSDPPVAVSEPGDAEVELGPRIESPPAASPAADKKPSARRNAKEPGSDPNGMKLAPRPYRR